eukprot:gb/GECG01001107.1/.p1 GENE.gb/GECG01001107.1/~~gb/GECG01001107.1/.p1  ORF type:complete len:194 (+),score=16.79 gb/GECG01001107.1/:1-582(+)
MGSFLGLMFKESCLTSEEQDPLFAACSLGDIEAVRSIMDSLESKHKRKRKVKQASPTMESFTLDINRIVNDVRLGGLTPLHVAVIQGQSDVVKTLIEEFGASVDIRSIKFGDTPLHDAVYNRDEKMTHMLIEYGADPSVQDYDGKSPLNLAKMDERFWGSNGCRKFLEGSLKRNQSPCGAYRFGFAQTMPGDN